MEELHSHFKLSNSVEDAAIILDNLQINSGETYNIEFIRYTFQLDQKDNIFYYWYYQGLITNELFTGCDA